MDRESASHSHKGGPMAHKSTGMGGAVARIQRAGEGPDRMPVELVDHGGCEAPAACKAAEVGGLGGGVTSKYSESFLLVWQ